MARFKKGQKVQLDPNSDYANDFSGHPSVAALLTGRRAVVDDPEYDEGNVLVLIEGPDPFGSMEDGKRLLIVREDALLENTDEPESVDLTEILPFASQADRAILALRLGRGRKMGVRAHKKDGTLRVFNGSVAYDDLHGHRAFIHDTNAAQREGDSGYRTILLDKVLTVTVGGKRYLCR